MSSPPDLSPCRFLPWSLFYGSVLPTPSSSSTQGHSWGAPCRRASPGELCSVDSRLPLPFSSLPAGPWPLLSSNHGLLSYTHILFLLAPLPCLSRLAYRPNTRMSPLLTTSSSPNPLWHQEDDASSVLLMGLKSVLQRR